MSKDLCFLHATTTMKHSVEILNGIRLDLIQHLLERIGSDSLGSLNNSISISKQEYSDWSKATETTQGDFDLLISFFGYILEQSTFYRLNGKEFHYYLIKNAGVEESVASIISTTWETVLKTDIVEHRKKNPFETDTLPRLNNVNWAIHMPLATEIASERILRNNNCTTCVTMEFELSDGPGKPDSGFKVEWSHDELYHFFNDIEKIQQQLDKNGDTSTAACMEN